jgi:hypothetical protein
MKDAIKTLPMPDGYIEADRLNFFLEKSPKSLQSALNKQYAKTVKSYIYSNTEAYIDTFDTTSMIHAEEDFDATRIVLDAEEYPIIDIEDFDEDKDSYYEDDEMSYDSRVHLDPDAPVTCILAEDIHKALPSLFTTTARASLLTAPRTVVQHRLPPDHFRFALCCCHRIPLFKKPIPCKCGKYIDIYGDHFFECPKYSKQWLHNKCRDINISWMKKIAPVAATIPTASSVLSEPSRISKQFPGVQPIDVGLNTTSGLKGIDVTITGSPPIAKDNQDQIAVSLKLHTQKEIQKWRGTS